MKRFLKIVLPIIVFAICFSLIYLVTRPQVALPKVPEIYDALSLLQTYGYESRQIVGVTNYAHLAICFVSFVATCILYFYFYDCYEKKQILKLVDYTRKINQRIYDLKLDENGEDELSLLANELYKTTVLLKEAALRDRARAKSLETALADISHQLRTPLTALQITLDNLYDNPDLDTETRRTFLKTASRQATQMSELIVTLLNLAKFDNGTLKMRPQKILASNLLGQVVQNLDVLSELSGVSIVISGEPTAKLNVDPKWQAQALTNIVKNCIEHSASGQTVTITVEQSAIFTRFVISDSGEGIAPEDLRHVFERFYKAKNATDDSVGIGLAFAKAIIESSGGQVKVRSRLGLGTKYIVTYFNDA